MFGTNYLIKLSLVWNVISWSNAWNEILDEILEWDLWSVLNEISNSIKHCLEWNCLMKLITFWQHYVLFWMKSLIAWSTVMKSLIKLITVCNYFSGKIKHCLKLSLWKKLVSVLEFYHFVLEMSWKRLGTFLQNYVDTLGGVLKKKCSENMQQVYRRTYMSKCDFKKGEKQLYWNYTSTWVVSYIFRAPFSKNNSGGLLLITGTEGSTLINEFDEEVSLAS